MSTMRAQYAPSHRTNVASMQKALSRRIRAEQIAEFENGNDIFFLNNFQIICDNFFFFLNINQIMLESCSNVRWKIEAEMSVFAE